METIYLISGGGQQIISLAERGMTVFYEVKESSWPEDMRVFGVDAYTNTMWSTDLADLQRWSNE